MNIQAGTRKLEAEIDASRYEPTIATRDKIGIDVLRCIGLHPVIAGDAMEDAYPVALS